MQLEDWRNLVDTLESLIPYYERLNHFITFFMLWKWRNVAAKLAERDDEVLEIGSGPGNFSKFLETRRIYCLDPSEKMLLWYRKILNDERYNSIMGIGENLPLKDGHFDKVYCLFSFRDFLDREQGSREILRVLKKGGSFIVIDIFKPTSPLRKRIVELWMKHGTRLMVKLLVPKSKDIWYGNPYEQFLKTYEDFDTEEGLKTLTQSLGFEDVKTKYLGFGACMLVATKGDGE